MPLTIKYDLPGAMAQTATNIGNFATDQALAAQSLRERAFAEDVARSQAQFALGGYNNAFQQRQQLNDDAFRRQQFETANQFRQQDLDADNAYRQQALAAQLERSRIGADASIYNTMQRGEAARDVAGLRAENAMNIADLNAQTRAGIAGMQEFGRGNRQQNQFAQQDLDREDKQRFVQDRMQNDQEFRREIELLQFDQQQLRDNAQRDYLDTRDYNQYQYRLKEIEARTHSAAEIALQRAQLRAASADPVQQRIQSSQEMRALANQINMLQRIASQKDQFGRPTPQATQAATQVPSLIDSYEEMRKRFGQMGAGGQTPNVQQVYGQPATAGVQPSIAPPAQAPAGGMDPQALAGVQQLVANLKARAQQQGLDPNDPQVKAEIRRLVEQQLQATPR